jgi:uncharacterized protein (DUF1499 family)
LTSSEPGSDNPAAAAPSRRGSKVRIAVSALVVVLGVLCVLALIAGIAIRRAGNDLAVWHIDPLTSTTTGNPNWYRLVPEDAQVDRDSTRDGEAPTYVQSKDEVARAFDTFVRSESNVEVLAGAASDGFVTYIQRSTLFGFPDYVSVKFIDLPDGGSTIAIFSRARYGRSDFDVNEKRVNRWIDGTTAALS